MVKLIALKTHPVGGHRVKAGETYEVSDRDARMMIATRKAAVAPEDSPEPVYRRGVYKRRDIPASPATTDLTAGGGRETRGRVSAASGGAGGVGGSGRPVGAMRGEGSGLTPPPAEAAPPRRRRTRRSAGAEEPADEGETE